MNFSALECIEVLQDSHLFDERENGRVHTPYETETMFFSCIKNGHRSSVKLMMHELLKGKIVTGKMSNDPLRQMQYWAVSAITLAARYAIQGGLDQTTAYNFSDNCILKIDNMKNNDNILDYLRKKCLELTDMVAQSRENSVYPKPVRYCLHYIHTHLHEDLSVSFLARKCHLSDDYLAALFKKNTGITLAKYIRKQRLYTARDMLCDHYSISEISYYLGFCSESYFIKCFKDEFSITPRQYRNSVE